MQKIFHAQFSLEQDNIDTKSLEQYREIQRFLQRVWTSNYIRQISVQDLNGYHLIYQSQTWMKLS